MIEIKDYETGKEYKFEHISNGVELLSVGINFVGDRVIYGIAISCGKRYHVEWELDGELYRTHSDLANACLNLTPIVEPKPCPFCGGTDLSKGTTAEGNWYIDCNCCKVFVNTYKKTKDEAIEVWNWRN